MQNDSARLFGLLLGNFFYPIAADARDQFRCLLVYRFGKGGKHTEGLKGNGTLISDLRQSLDKTLPVANVLRSIG